MSVADPPGSKKAKTRSELLFEQYLGQQGITTWGFEPDFEGKTKRPDYLVRFGGDQLLFEIKEFRQKTDAFAGFGKIGSLTAIREKINAGREKFRDFRDYCCSLVLHNVNDLNVRLDYPGIVLASMLGDLGMRFIREERGGESGTTTENVFVNRGGKMVDYKHERPQNTTISTVIVLDHYAVTKRELEIEVARREETTGVPLTRDEWIELIQQYQARSGSENGRLELRTVVYENPYAKIPLPRTIFNGQFDERWGPEGDRIVRVFTGSEIQRLNAEV